MSTPTYWDTSRLRQCPTLNLLAGTQWHRIARLFGGVTALKLYASKESRFDLLGLYLADHIAGGLVETRLVFVDKATGQYVLKNRADLAARYLYRCRVKRNLFVANITAAIDEKIVSQLATASHVHDTTLANLETLYLTISQPFGHELRRALPDVDGFFWASRMGLGFNLLLFAEPDDCLAYDPPILLLNEPIAQGIIASLDAGRVIPFA